MRALVGLGALCLSGCALTNLDQVLALHGSLDVENDAASTAFVARVYGTLVRPEDASDCACDACRDDDSCDSCDECDDECDPDAPCDRFTLRDALDPGDACHVADLVPGDWHVIVVWADAHVTSHDVHIGRWDNDRIVAYYAP